MLPRLSVAEQGGGQPSPHGPLRERENQEHCVLRESKTMRGEATRGVVGREGGTEEEEEDTTNYCGVERKSRQKKKE